MWAIPGRTRILAVEGRRAFYYMLKESLGIPGPRSPLDHFPGSLANDS